MTGFKFRRTITTNLFDKSAKLSAKSISETNCGKMISLISADLMMADMAFVMFPLIFVGPFAALLVCGLIWYKFNWFYGFVFYCSP